MSKKFYDFKISGSEKELYLYGAIFSEKWNENDITSRDFIDTLDSINDNETLNIYINSPGGDVFVTDAIIAMLIRSKQKKNISINAYIDGLGASCASWLPMVADNIYIYDQSVLMLHKPWTNMFCVNADDMKKEIEILDKLENSMVKMYLDKAKEGVTEEQIRNILSNETWLDADEIEELFNVTRIEATRQIAACIDSDMFSKYKNVPISLIKEEPKINEKEIEKQKEEAKRLALQNKINEIEIALALIG